MINVPKYEFVGPNTTGETHNTKRFFEQILNRGTKVEVCLQQMNDIDLAGYNLLIAAYLKAERMGTPIHFSGGQLTKLKHLKDLTQLHHVFA